MTLICFDCLLMSIYIFACDTVLFEDAAEDGAMRNETESMNEWISMMMMRFFMSVD